ncbi:hypothetical protein GBAR_LOCUS30649 [Geodia barretti]|uniref:Uncharacterized protein n=1 Tax=Geodia barretti TaxID=519541 RepID=A0AA35XL59_GEOBA|nr:hypothetical protein GBAR_LOCUS30649 [Geodia barretti]
MVPGLQTSRHGGDAPFEALQLLLEEVWELSGHLLGKVDLHFGRLLLQVGLAEIKQMLHIHGPQTLHVDGAWLRGESERCLLGDVFPVAATQDPVDDPAIIAEPGPDEVPLGVLAEPVHVEHLWKFGTGSLLHLAPVLHVLAEVVAKKRSHGKRIVEDDFLPLVIGGCGRRLRAKAQPHVDRVLPAERFEHQRDCFRATPTKQNGVDRNSTWVLPVGVKVGTLHSGGAETRVWVRGGVRLLLGSRQFLPALYAEPGGNAELGRSLVLKPLPEHASVRRQCDVGIDGVLTDGFHGVGVGLHVGASRDTKETILGVDGPKSTVGTEPHPGNVVADEFGLPAGESGGDHGQVGLAALAREGSCDVLLHPLRVGKPQDLHVLGQPALVSGNGGRNPQSKTLLPQERVPAIPAAKRLDLPPLRKVGDGNLLRITGPGVVIGGTRSQWDADRMETADEIPFPECLEDAGPHPRHLSHADDHVGRVGELDTNLTDV